MLGHASAVLTLDTYADLFPDDLELVSAALDTARQASLGCPADALRTEEGQGPRPGFLARASELRQRVGVAGFEPTTSSSRTKRATKLRHTPREATTAYRTGLSAGQTPATGRRNWFGDHVHDRDLVADRSVAGWMWAVGGVVHNGRASADAVQRAGIDDDWVGGRGLRRILRPGGVVAVHHQ
jgi:hypothetical protein